MSDLLRQLAPITDEGWSAIEDEAKRAMTPILAARRVVDFTGPLGWTASSASLGRAESLKQGPQKGVTARLRVVRPLMELRTEFEVSRAELEAIGRGNQSPNLDAAADAGRQAALAEDTAVFHGYGAGGIEGISEAAGKRALTIPEKYEAYLGVVVEAVSRLQDDGVSGPYGIALGPQCYAGLTKTLTVGGFPVIQNLKHVLDGPVVRAPAIDGAIVLSMRGGDFELVVGQDFSIGYVSHSDDTVRLYIQESCTFLVHDAAAAVPLRYRKR